MRINSDDAGSVFSQAVMDYFARSGSLVGYAELIRGMGIEPGLLMRMCGLDPALLDFPDRYLDYTRLAELMELSSAMTGQPDFGMRLGLKQGLEVVGALGSFMALQTTVGDSLWLLQRNLNFHAHGADLSWAMSGSQLELTVDVQFAQPHTHPQLHMLNAALIVQGCGQLQSFSLSPLLIHFAFAKPDGLNQRQVEHLLGCPVNWNSHSNRVVWPATLIGVPVNLPAELAERLADDSRHAHWPQDKPDLAQRVRHAIHALLPTGECRLEIVARILQAHPRSLQASLRNQGLTYGQLLHETRLQLACYHLSQTRVDLTTLAMNLGYSELAVFSRHFKAWTGKSPRDWRKSDVHAR